MEYLYPGGLAKAITFSYDDGQVYDRRLIEIFNQAGFKGTFHLNSGNLDKDGYVQKAELPTLYAEHEIACHGVTHRHPPNENGRGGDRPYARGRSYDPAGRTDRRYCAGHELCLWRILPRTGGSAVRHGHPVQPHGGKHRKFCPAAGAAALETHLPPQ